MFRRSYSNHGQNAKHVRSIEKLESRCLLSISPPTVTDVSVSSTSWDGEFFSYLDSSGLGSDGYSIPVGSPLQSNPIPWSGINRISIAFSEDVDVQAHDLSISGVVNEWYSIDDFFYDPEFSRATWILATALAEEERVHLDLDGDGVHPVADLEGNVLDGEWLDELSIYPSGGGSAGGDFEFRFNTISGDHHATGLVDQFDYFVTISSVGLSINDAGYDPMVDNDGSSLIDSSDVQAVIDNESATLPMGEPLGVSFDAPTTTGFQLATITDRTSETRISLHDVFDDLEDSDTELSYTIVSQSNNSLFDSVTVDVGAGELVLDPADTGWGRNRIVVQATDSSGLAVRAELPVDVDYVNSIPIIVDLTPAFIKDDIWAVYGSVQDGDDVVEGLIVELSGLFSGRAVVMADGTFTYKQSIGSASGFAFAQTSDRQGGESLLYAAEVGL